MKRRSIAAIMASSLFFTSGCAAPHTTYRHNSLVRIRQGQAVWHAEKGPELAGELILIRSSDAELTVQFSKPPVTLLTAQSRTNRWSADFPPNQHFSGRGDPPDRLIFLQLAKILDGQPARTYWNWTTNESGWRLENRKSGEWVEGFLGP